MRTRAPPSSRTTSHAQARARGAGAGRAPRLAVARPSGAAGGVDHRRAVECAGPIGAGGQRPRCGAALRGGRDGDVRCRGALGARRRRRRRPGVATLLAHRDNDGERVVELVAAMLGKREQWLRLPWNAAPAGLRALLERTLADEIDGELAIARATLAGADWAGLAPLATAAAAQLDASGGAPPDLVEALSILGRTASPPATAVAALPQWQALADWLLVKRPGLAQEGERQARLSRHRQGAGQRGPAAAQCGDGDGCSAMANPPRSASAAPRPRAPPGRYEEPTWDVIAALLSVLPRAAAHLATVFAERGAVDFSQGSLAALAALGSPRRRATCCCGRTSGSSTSSSTSSRTRRSRSSTCSRASPPDGPPATAARCSRSAIRCSRSTASAAPRSACSSTRSSRGDRRRAGRAVDAAAQLPRAGAPGRLGERGLSGGAGRGQRSVARRGRVRAGGRKASGAGRSGGDLRAPAATDAEAGRVVAHVRAALAGDGDVAILARSRNTSRRSCRRCARRASGMPPSISTSSATGPRCSTCRR